MYYKANFVGDMLLKHMHFKDRRSKRSACCRIYVRIEDREELGYRDAPATRSVFLKLSDLPLHVVGECLVGLLEEGPVRPAQREGNRRQTEGAVPRDIVVNSLNSHKCNYDKYIIHRFLQIYIYIYYIYVHLC